MQDYIFNSRKQARRRRRRLLVRLVLLIALSAIAALLFSNFSNLSLFSPTPEEQKEERDLLPLPPVEKTKPVTDAGAPTSPSEAEPTPSTAEPTLAEAPTPATETQRPPVADELATSEQEQPAVAEQTDEEQPAAKVENTLNWTEHLIEQGDTLAAIFKNLNLAPALLHEIVNSSKMASKLAHIRPGQKLKLALDEDGALRQIILQRDRISSLNIQRSDSGYQAEELSREVERREAVAQGHIATSLFVDGQKAGLSDAQVMELATIFGWDIDFALELREGDQFYVIYEEIYLDGEKLRNGPILAAEFVNQGKTYRAIRYTDSNGETAYYDPDGHAKRRAFIRTPVKFARISSGFTRKRWHPVLKKWRSHKGVDYAAPKGTPVKATGNGRVVFRGKKGGYGNVIFLRHGGKYTTVYGHLSRFAKGLKNGSKVKQGQVIGYVGSTGLATGPHLHYEFRINGVHRNPLTVKLPKTMRLPKKEMARFLEQTRPAIAQLDELRAKSMVASAAH